MKKLGEFDDPLTYSLPTDFNQEAHVGDLVSVTLRGRSANGFITEILDSLPSGLDESKILPFVSILQSCFFNSQHIETSRFISTYYRVSLARSLRLLIPRLFWNGRVDAPTNDFITAQSFSEKLSPKQTVLFEKIKSQTKPILLSNLKKDPDFNSSSFSGLLKKGAISKQSLPVYHPFGSKDFSPIPFDKVLTLSQKKAVESILNSKNPVLLHGVTGSGKTEVYFRLIQETILAGKQAILLLPEISLTPQMVRYFSEAFKGLTAIFHSRLTDARRLDEWWKVKSGACPIVIGSRSALFSPCDNIGLIVVDEEHEWTYKQESMPYYETHTVAEKMAAFFGARLVFGSATPKTETYYRAQSGDYELVELPERVNESELPGISVIDMREEFKKKNYGIFSDKLFQEIKLTLSRKEQVILFVNQRGHANAVVCRDCGFTEMCPHCDITFKLHHSYPNQAILKCHYCDTTKSPPLMCPECRSPYIKNIGVGTQRVEAEIRKLFPESRVLRADRDTTNNAAGFEPIYEAFLNRKADILIGTQMIAKGLDFSNVRLIGLVMADVGLHVPDFRSGERLFQIITQVSGRCGRGDSKGIVVLQTYNPTHPVIQAASNYSYSDFIQRELSIRSKHGYPPYSRMIKFTVVGKDQESLTKHIQNEQAVIEDIFKLNNLKLQVSSAPSLVPKIADRFYYHVIIRSVNPEDLFHYWKTPKGWRVDVDPVHTV